MVIKFYGTRGSVPVSGKETMKYGGNTTCLYVESDSGDTIVVDAGSGIRELGYYLLEHKRNKIHLIFTHYHWDHTQGLSFFTPIFLKDSVITIYGPKKEVIPERALSYQMTRPYWPVTLADTQSKIVYKDLKSKFKIGTLKIETIVNNHPNYTMGLKFTENKNSFAFLSDNELSAKDGNVSYRTRYEKFVEFVKDVAFFIHDAAYNDDIYPNRLGWGHSTYSQVMQFAKDSGVKKIIFTHHDPPNTDKFIDGNVREMRDKYPKYSIQAAADGKTIILK